MSDDEQSLLDWFEQGREARLGRTPKDQNPYPRGEASHDAWDRGWDDANNPSEKAKGYA